jgi:hypothetical protein
VQIQHSECLAVQHVFVFSTRLHPQHNRSNKVKIQLLTQTTVSLHCPTEMEQVKMKSDHMEGCPRLFGEGGLLCMFLLTLLCSMCSQASAHRNPKEASTMGTPIICRTSYKQLQVNVCAR